MSSFTSRYIKKVSVLRILVATQLYAGFLPDVLLCVLFRLEVFSYSARPIPRHCCKATHPWRYLLSPRTEHLQGRYYAERASKARFNLRRELEQVGAYFVLYCGVGLGAGDGVDWSCANVLVSDARTARTYVETRLDFVFNPPLFPETEQRLQCY